MAAKEELERLRQQHGAPPTVGGVPLDDYVAMAQQRNPGAIDPVARESAERARQQKATPHAMAMLQQLRQEAGVSDINTTGNPNIVTSDTYRAPVPTGGSRFSVGGAVTDFMAERREAPEPPNWDSEEAVRRERQAQGVRFDKGLPFFQRLRMAQESQIPSRRKQVLAEMLSDLPEGTTMQWDTMLEQWYVPMRITEADVKSGMEQPEDIGRYRYVAVDEEQFSFADLADMFQMNEILSLGMATAGAGKFQRMVTIPSNGLKAKAVRFGSEAGGQASLGTLGRLGGDAYRIAFSMLASDGEWSPTKAELMELFGDEAKVELVAGVLGEVVGRGLGKSTEWVQDVFANMTGRTGAYGSKADIETWNKNIASARQDLRTIRTEFGEKDYYMTEGEATGSIKIIETENSLRKNQKDQTKRDFEAKEWKARAAAGRYTAKVLRETDPTLGYAGVVNRANESFRNNNVVVANVQVGRDPYNLDAVGEHRITFTMKNMPEEYGLALRPGVADRADTWEVTSVILPPEARRTGISDDLYLSAAAEARAHNKRLVSDTKMTEAGVDLWERLIGEHEEFANVKRLSNDRISSYVDDDGIKWFVADSPIFEMPAQDRLIPRLLKPEFTRPTVNAKTGEITTPSTISGIFRGEAANARNFRAQLMDEMEKNHFLRHEMQKAFLDDYRWSVYDPKTGRIDPQKFLKWKKETSAFADMAFTPEQMLRIKRPGGLDEVIAEESQRLSNLETSLRREFNIGDTFNLKDWGEAKGQLWNKYASMTSPQRRRAMLLLNQTGMGDEFRGFLFRDISNVFIKAMNSPHASMSKASDILGQVHRKKDLIMDMFPGQRQRAEEYYGHLMTIARTVDRKSFGSIKGTRQEANPNVLALTRVIFGPLSRAQRFLTAARRVQTRAMGESAIRIVQNPEALRDMMQIKQYPVGTRQAGAFLTRMGLGEALGVGDPLDMNDPENVQELINWMNDVESAMEKAANE